jgi:transaldolase
MAQVGVKSEASITAHYKAIYEIVDGDISDKVSSTDFSTMLEEGKRFTAIQPNIFVKITMIKDGIKAIKWSTDNGICINCTLVYSAGQAILA